MVVINNIGDYIKSVRKEKKITSRKLAELSHVSQAYISQLETGKHSSPSPDVLERIAKALEIPYLHIMEKAGYTKESDRIEILQTQLVALEETKIHKEIAFKNAAFQLGRTDLSEKDRSHLEKIFEESNSEIQKIDNAITSLTELIRSSEHHKEATYTRNLIESFVGESKTNVELENLFNSAQEITINGKVLTDEEKQKALQILKLTFDK